MPRGIRIPCFQRAHQAVDRGQKRLLEPLRLPADGPLEELLIPLPLADERQPLPARLEGVLQFVATDRLEQVMLHTAPQAGVEVVRDAVRDDDHADVGPTAADLRNEPQTTLVGHAQVGDHQGRGLPLEQIDGLCGGPGAAAREPKRRGRPHQHLECARIVVDDSDGSLETDVAAHGGSLIPGGRVRTLRVRLANSGRRGRCGTLPGTEFSHTERLPPR